MYWAVNDYLVFNESDRPIFMSLPNETEKTISKAKKGKADWILFN